MTTNADFSTFHGLIAGLQAFWATERFTNAACGDVVGE